MSEAQRYVATGKPFAVTLAERIVDGPSHPLAADAAKLARTKLDNHARSPDGSDDAEVVSAAAILADFGGAEEQLHLLELLRTHGSTAAPTPFYESLVRGVTNRYTPNRIAFLRPLLDDRRQRIGPSTKHYRYCEPAVTPRAAVPARLSLPYPCCAPAPSGAGDCSTRRPGCFPGGNGAMIGIAQKLLTSQGGSGAGGPSTLLTSPSELNSHSQTPITATLAVT